MMDLLWVEVASVRIARLYYTRYHSFPLPKRQHCTSIATLYLVGYRNKFAE